MGARLFGRDPDVGRVVAAFERVAERQQLGVIWVHGDAGVGKTSLVEALHAARPEARWGTAKFAEHAAPLPFGAALAVLSSLLRDRLAEADEDLDLLAQRMRGVLGASAGALASVVPELTRLLGPQTPPPVLDARDGESRFRAQLERALGALAEPARPLVLVFDDLQWADAVHLRLLHGLASSAERLPVLIVGVWRDHVPLPPAFVALRESLSERGIATDELALSPLGADAIRALVADRTGAKSDELDAIVLPRAAGNPLLAEALVAELVRGSAIVRTHGAVHVDAGRLEKLQVDAGLGALLAGRIDALDERAREVLAVLSWFPASATHAELARACELGLDEVEAALTSAAELGLVGSGPRIGFLHDRIREVARPTDARAARLARAVVERLVGRATSPTEAELFLAADLVGLAAPTPETHANDLALARTAGRLAHAAGDFTRAARHLRVARHLAGPGDLELAFELVESSIADGAFTDAEALLGECDVRDRAPIDRARALYLVARLHVAQNRSLEAVEASKAALAELGVVWPTDLASCAAIAVPTAAELAALPLMTDPADLLAMRILGEMVPPTVMACPDQAPALSATAIALTVARGLSAAFAPALATHSLVALLAGDLTRADEQGRTALSIFDRCPQAGLEIRTAFPVYSTTHHWMRPMRESHEAMLALVARALEHGDSEFASYTAVVAPVCGLLAGEPLASMRALADSAERLAIGRGWAWVTSWTRILLQFVDDVSGPQVPDVPLSGPRWSSAVERPKLQAAKQNPAYVLDDFFAAWAHAVAGRWPEVRARLAGPTLGMTGTYIIPLWTELRGVAAAACGDVEVARECREQIASWVRHAPEQHGHRLALLDAELGEDAASVREAFEDAARRAEGAGLFERALVSSRYARWLERRGERTAARALDADAALRLREWGVGASRDEARALDVSRSIDALEQPDGGVARLAERLREIAGAELLDVYAVDTGVARAVLRVDASGAHEVDALVDDAPEAIRAAVRLAYHGNLFVEREHGRHIIAVPLRKGAVVRAVVAGERDPELGGLGEAAQRELRIVGALWLSSWERKRARDELRRMHASLRRAGEARAEAVESQERMRRELEQTHRLETVGRLTASVAHDLNNIVTVFAMCADLISDTGGLSPSLQQEVSAELVSAVRHSSSLTRQLLALSRPPAARDELVRTELALAELERLLRRLVAPLVQVSVEVPADECPVRLDRGAFEQIVLNLVLNARDAMPDGGPVHVRLARVGNEVVLEVRDRGHGMDEATRRRIFEPFFTTKGPSKGTGLGLSTVLGVVERAGGRVDVDSEPGRGTTFYVHLPVASAEVVVRAAPRRAAGTADRRALLLETDEALRRLLARLLERRGFSVTTPAEQSAAEQAVGALEPNTLVIDGAGARWPHVEVALDRRRKLAQLPVLRLSAPDEPVPETGDFVVPKPLGPGALDEALARIDAARAGLSRAG
ncbi:AAA family ATPase [Myxococcota bacterium]|nr:AAA family ATPase [Myxococcota bacterium]